MRRLVVVLGAMVALVAFAPLVTSGQEGTPTPDAAVPGRTDVRYFVPFDRDGLNGALSVTESVTGTCTADSIPLPDRPDAFDCITDESEIYDPCFENPFAPIDAPGELACVDAPFDSDVVMLAVDEPLPRAKEPPPGTGPFAPWDLPWALELANGDRCTLLRGTLYVIAGQTVYYGCEQQGQILGEVDRSQPVWTVNYHAEGAVASGIVAVAVAWS